MKPLLQTILFLGGLIGLPISIPISFITLKLHGSFGGSLSPSEAFAILSPLISLVAFIASIYWIRCDKIEKPDPHFHVRETTMTEHRFNGPFARLLRNYFTNTRSPDPWSGDIDRETRKRSAIPICTNCLSPQFGHHWFCPNCRFPSGNFVHVMPYLYLFTLGEVLRRGVTGPPEKGAFRKLGLVILSFQSYAVFAPIYWFWMVRKSIGKPICESDKPEPRFHEEL